MKISTIIFLILSFPIFAKTSTIKDCKKENAQACYDKGFEIFNTLDKAKNDAEGYSIKKNAAEYFKKGCSFGHEKSCKEVKAYEDFLKKDSKI